MTNTIRFVRSDGPTTQGAKSRRDDPRMAARMVSLDSDLAADRVQAILLGVADDRGVTINGGRQGAADGPAKFRDYFSRLPVPAEFGHGSIVNAGDLMAAEHTAETHARLAEVIFVLRERFPQARLVVVGGGHDHAYGEVLGLARSMGSKAADSRIGVVNIDAHADVRPHTTEPHSGTPFRRLLLEPAARLAGPSLVEFGLQRASNAAIHLAFLQQHHVQVVMWDDIVDGDRAASEQLLGHMTRLAQTHAAISLSVDMDAFPLSAAPGVSAPSAVGVSPGAIVRAAAAFGALPIATQLGIYELNPRFDQDGATTRLATRIAWSYITGLL